MTIAGASFGLLILALISQVFWILVRPRVGNIVSLILLPLATLGLLIDLIIRSTQISFVAITNTYEALIFLSGAMGILLSWLQFRLRRQDARPQASSDPRGGSQFVIFGGSLLMLLFLALASSPLVPD
ncbi:hypothetical protein KQH65_12745, partial [archaeon]|nr:hypothetical protein [archaeon]